MAPCAAGRWAQIWRDCLLTSICRQRASKQTSRTCSDAPSVCCACFLARTGLSISQLPTSIACSCCPAPAASTAAAAAAASASSSSLCSSAVGFGLQRSASRRQNSSSAGRNVNDVVHRKQLAWPRHLQHQQVVATCTPEGRLCTVLSLCTAFCQRQQLQQTDPRILLGSDHNSNACWCSKCPKCTHVRASRTTRSGCRSLDLGVIAGGGRMLAGGLLNTSASSLPTAAAAAAEDEEAAAAQAAAAAAAGPRSAAAAPKFSVRCWRVPGVTAALLLAALAADGPAAAAGVRCGRWPVAGVAAAALLLDGLATGVRAGVLLLLPGAPAGTHTGAWALAAPLLAPTRAAEAGAGGVAPLVAVLLPASRFCRLLPAAALLPQPALLLPSKKVGVVLPACCSAGAPPANPVKELTPLGLPASTPAAAAPPRLAALARVAFAPVARSPAAAAERAGVRSVGLLLLAGLFLVVLPPAAACCRRAEKGKEAGVSSSMSHSDPSWQSLPSPPAASVGREPAPVLPACSTTGAPAVRKSSQAPMSQPRQGSAH